MSANIVVSSSDKTAFTRQLYMVLISSMGAFMIGCVNGWTAPAIPRLIAGEESLSLTNDEVSWLALFSELGHFVAPIPTGIIADYVGRKVVFVFGGILEVSGWWIMSFTSEFTYLCIGRTILGLTFGIQAAIMNIYIAEISDKRWRGTFGSLNFFFLSAGILFQFIVGGYFTIHTTVIVTAIIGVVHVLLLSLFIVESPYYLLTKAEEAAAKDNLKWLRASENVDSEFDQIIKRMVAKVDLVTLAKNLKSNPRGFVLCVLITFLVEFTGRTMVLTYATVNFQSQNVMSANHLTILLGIFNVLLPVVPILLSDKVGRKILMLISTAIAGVMHLSTGSLYFCHSVLHIEIPYFGWLLLFTITAYLCSCTIMGTSVMTLRGELLPENSRGMGSGFGSMGSGLAAFTSIKLFQVILDSSGEHTAFWTFGGVCFTCLIIVWVFLPETKNRTFEEIQKSLEMADVDIPTVYEKNEKS